MLFRAYNASGEMLAKLEHAEDAAAFVAYLGDGAEVRHLSSVVWREGQEQFSASESYDGAAAVMDQRIVERDQKRAIGTAVR